MATKSMSVAERAKEQMESMDKWARASEVAEAIDSGTDYTRTVLNNLHAKGEVEKKEEGVIIGTSINGSTYVLDTKEQAMNVIRIHGGLSEGQMATMSLGALRSYIKGNLGDQTGPIGSKVWFKRD